MDMRKLIGPLVSVHQLVLFFSDMYCFFNQLVRFVAFSVDDLGLWQSVAWLQVMAWSVTADLLCLVNMIIRRLAIAVAETSIKILNVAFY